MFTHEDIMNVMAEEIGGKQFEHLRGSPPPPDSVEGFMRAEAALAPTFNALMRKARKGGDVYFHQIPHSPRVTL